MKDDTAMHDTATFHFAESLRLIVASGITPQDLAPHLAEDRHVADYVSALSSLLVAHASNDPGPTMQEVEWCMDHPRWHRPRGHEPSIYALLVDVVLYTGRRRAECRQQLAEIFATLNAQDVERLTEAMSCLSEERRMQLVLWFSMARVSAPAASVVSS